MVDPEWSSDPLILFGNYALFTHPLARANRELLADLMALALDDDLTVNWPWIRTQSYHAMSGHMCFSLTTGSV